MAPVPLAGLLTVLPAVLLAVLLAVVSTGPAYGLNGALLGEALGGDELRDLRTKFRSSNKYVRKDAVEALAKRTELEAWSLLVDALEDDQAEVADTAAFLLGRMPTEQEFEELREDLAGERGVSARDVQVRRYAAELMGRFGSASDVGTLIKALKDKDPIVRRLLVYSLQRMLEDGVVSEADLRPLIEAFERILKRDKDPLVRARSLAALGGALGASQRLVPDADAQGSRDSGMLEGEFGRQFEAALAASAKSKFSEVRAAAALLLGESGAGSATVSQPDAPKPGAPKPGAPEPDAPEPDAPHSDARVSAAGPALNLLSGLAEDEVVSVRTAAMLGLGQLVRGQDSLAIRKSALEILVTRLAEEQAAALSWRIMDELQALSGLKYRRDVRPWRAWVEALPLDWKPQVSGDAKETSAAAGSGDRGQNAADRTASLVGLPIRSGSIAFLIDFSGSTWHKNKAGQTVKSVLDVKLREALEALPADTRFLLVPFADDPMPWREELVDASPRNVQKALSWFEKANFQGRGNAWDAMLFAHDIEGLDTMVMLSDGAPSGGVRYRLELITSLYLERNLGRQIMVDSVIVGAGSRVRGFWSELSRKSGGRMLAVTL